MICKECGEEIKDGARFCPFCGTVQNVGEGTDQKDNAAVTDKNKAAFKDPVFKTSKNKPEDPKKAKARSIKQKLIDVLLVILIIAIASGVVAYKVITLRKANSLFSMVAYVKDGTIYLDTDITSENDEPLPVAETNNALLEYGFGNNHNIAAFSKDGKILYFMDKDTGDGSGRLKKVRIDKLTEDMDANLDRAEKVADFVTSYSVLDGGALLYETNEMEVCYYDGKNSKVIAEDVAYSYLSYSGNYVYLLEGDEQGLTFDLGKKGLNSKSEVEILAENVSRIIISKDSDAVMFIVENEDEGSGDEESKDKESNELYLAFDNKEPVKIGENVTDYSPYCTSAGGVFYTSQTGEENVTLNYYDVKNESVIEVKDISNVELQVGISVFQKEGSDDWFYMLAGGQEQLMDFKYEYTGGSVWSSWDGRYAMAELTDEDEEGSILASFRTTDGTFSSEKLVTENGRLGTTRPEIMQNTTTYYLAYDEEDEEIDLFSFHNDRTRLLAKDVEEDNIGVIVFAADKLVILFTADGREISIYKDGELAFYEKVQSLLYAGKNAAIYEDEEGCYITYLSGKEIETSTIVEGADVVIVPEEITYDCFFQGN